MPGGVGGGVGDGPAYPIPAEEWPWIRTLGCATSLSWVSEAAFTESLSFSPLQIDKGLTNVGYCNRRLWGGLYSIVFRIQRKLQES